MEIQNPLINHHNLLDFPVNPHSSPLSTGINHSSSDGDEMEMLSLKSMSYTSLKDVLQSPSPTSVSSPMSTSWREIPIKDPLVQHAAWAYLQPMAEVRGAEDRWWRRLIDERCCWLLACFNDVVLAVFNGWFAEERSDGGGRVD